jgi:hypothetical protein
MSNAVSSLLRVARKECKYRISPSQLPAITRYLQTYCVPDAYSSQGAWYPINTLYLDSADLRLYRETVQKLPFRFKLRIRSYGDAGGAAKLEVKRKLKDTIVKTSATISREDWDAASGNGLPALHQCCGPSAHAFLQLTESMHAMPRILMRYERLAFSSFVDDYVRVTFDRRITCQPVRSLGLSGDPRAWRALDTRDFSMPESAYVMEVKFCDRPASWVRDMVLHFGLEAGGFSKYGRAVRRTMGMELAWELRQPDASLFRSAAQ